MSITCSNCGKDNSLDNTFCGGCGKPLVMPSTLMPESRKVVESTCCRCGAKMPDDAVFCGICGKSLESEVANEESQAEPESESRRLPTTIHEESPAPDVSRQQQRSHQETNSAPEPTTTAFGRPFQVGSLLREMVVIPAGKFMMGSLPDYGNQDECPRHEVTLSSLQIDRFAVSNIEYELFRPDRKGRRTPTSSGDLDPVVFVNFDDCVKYCDWRSEQEGLPPGTYQLPIEAQWEYCARGGRNFQYPWGNEIMEGVCNTREIGLGKTVPVDEGLANGFNLLHMGSNVREWCRDWYNEAYYSMEASSGTDPQGPAAMAFVNTKVVRGASFQDPARQYARCAARHDSHPANGADDIGFRCVREV